MRTIKWKNGVSGGTPIPSEIWTFLMKLWKLGYIKSNTVLNAQFFNKYHPEILLEEHKKGKSINEIGKVFIKENI